MGNSEQFSFVSYHVTFYSFVFPQKCFKRLSVPRPSFYPFVLVSFKLKSPPNYPINYGQEKQLLSSRQETKRIKLPLLLIANKNCTCQFMVFENYRKSLILN